MKIIFQSGPNPSSEEILTALKNLPDRCVVVATPRHTDTGSAVYLKFNNQLIALNSIGYTQSFAATSPNPDYDWFVHENAELKVGVGVKLV